jgi:hypothetical protein
MMARKQKRRLCGTALRNTKLSTAYSALNALQTQFAFVFWFVEQRKTKLQDCINNERGAQ